MSRPLLFLDVDGPLNLYAAKPERRPDGYTTLRAPRVSVMTGAHAGLSARRLLRVWLNPDHGGALLRLGYEMCWATTWMDHANRWIGPVLGLPELPFVDFGEALFKEHPDGIHWKTGPLVDYARAAPSSGWTTSTATWTRRMWPPTTEGPGSCTMSVRGSVCGRTTSARSPSSPDPSTRRTPLSESEGKERKPAGPPRTWSEQGTVVAWWSGGLVAFHRGDARVPQDAERLHVRRRFGAAR